MARKPTNTKPDRFADPKLTSVDKPMAKFESKGKKSKAQYNQVVVDSGVDTFQNRLLIGTITTGDIRMEWAAARYGQSIPANWSKVDMLQYMSSYIPLRFSIQDGQNLIVNEVVTKNYEWLILIEHDTCPPADGFIRFNEYMRSNKYPLVSGLYFTKSEPAEPMIYRGRGNSYFTDWVLGDRIGADGVPTGMLLISGKLLKAVWEDSPEYMAGANRVRRVFDAPIKTFFNEETGAQEALTGPTDLNFCKRVIEGGYLEKCGWPELQATQYPFVIDTRISCLQVAGDGTQFPIGGINHWCGTNSNWPADDIVEQGVIVPELDELK